MNAEEAARAIGCSSKTVLRHIAKGTITATYKNPQELEIAEDQVEVLRRVLTSKSGQGTDMSAQMEKLIARVAELEERVKVLESGQTSPQSPVQTVPTPIVPTIKPPPSKPLNRNVARKSTLPEGCILASKFAEQIGIPRETFRDFLILGIGPGTVPGELTDPTLPTKEQIDYSERPKPGRPKEVERYLDLQQQEKALEILKRHGKLK
jgi:hypothetical protein